jgi:hypothetical protein
VESVVALLNTVHEADWAIFMRESAWAFPIAESVHVVAISLVVGFIAIVDLRLLGLASVEHALTKLTHDILPWTWGAFGLVVLSGVAMFVSQPALYFENTAFRIKALVLLLAGCNMLYFHLVTFRDIDNWDKSKSTPLAAKFAGGASLTFWVAIILLGRQVGFTMY